MSKFDFTVVPGAAPAPPDAADERMRLLGKDIYFDGDYAVTAAGDYATVEGVAALRASIYRRLITRPGEFRARPNYGVGITDFVKKRNTTATLDELRQRVMDQLSLDPRVAEVGEVVVEPIEDGLRLGIVVQAAGRTLKFEPFDFRERNTIGTLGVREGTGLSIRG